jgi:chaperonin GroES
MVRLEPINDYIILKKLNSEAIIEGIILPEYAGQQIIKAEVIGVGPGKVLDSGVRAPMQTKVGDTVLVNSLACAPTDLPLDESGEFLLIPERDIAAIIRQ